jgi:hypothetical protein
MLIGFELKTICPPEFVKLTDSPTDHPALFSNIEILISEMSQTRYTPLVAPPPPAAPPAAQLLQLQNLLDELQQYAEGVQVCFQNPFGTFGT